MEWLIGRARGRSSVSMSSTSDKEVAADAGDNKTDKLYLQECHVRDQLRLGVALEQLLLRPDGLDVNEWVATHVIALYDSVTALFEALSGLCTCTSMLAPGGVILGATDERGKKARCSARQYMESALTQAQDALGAFPRHHGQRFPAEFRASAALVGRHLLHLLAHFYAAHFGDLVRLELVPHLNTVMLHFLLFNAKYHLVDDKELELLADLQVALLRHSQLASAAVEVADGCSSI